MNYYEHHIGDYAQATAHLSFVEDAAYSRLIRKYYAEEKPLPADLKAVQRLVGARSRDERAAVQTILEEFFQPSPEGWRNKRCDDEIARYQESEPDREAKRESQKERQRRTRERRKELFDILRDHNIVPAYDTPMSELQSMVSRVTKPVTGAKSSQPVTRDDTATQTPDTRHQTPDTKSKPNPQPANDDVASNSAQGVAVAAWQPPDDAIVRLETETGIPVEFAHEVLLEFREFYAGKAPQTPQAWTSRFLQRCAEQHARRRKP